jgi:hypothetical protein
VSGVTAALAAEVQVLIFDVSFDFVAATFSWVPLTLPLTWLLPLNL